MLAHEVLLLAASYLTAFFSGALFTTSVSEHDRDASFLSSILVGVTFFCIFSVY